MENLLASCLHNFAKIRRQRNGFDLGLMKDQSAMSVNVKEIVHSVAREARSNLQRNPSKLVHMLVTVKPSSCTTYLSRI